MENQPQQQEMTPEEAKASLGVATFLQDKLIPQVQQQPEPGQENGQEQAATEQPEPELKEPNPEEDMRSRMSEMELNINKKFDEMRKEMKDDNQREIDSLKETITNALKD